MPVYRGGAKSQEPVPSVEYVCAACSVEVTAANAEAHAHGCSS